MIGLDTNIIARIITRDDPAQLKIIQTMFAKNKGRQFFVSISVIQEIFWLLKAKYKYEKSEIITALRSLLKATPIVVEKDDIIAEALDIYEVSAAGFIDVLIGLTNKYYGCKKSVTFDGKAANLDEFELL